MQPWKSSRSEDIRAKEHTDRILKLERSRGMPPGKFS